MSGKNGLSGGRTASLPLVPKPKRVSVGSGNSPVSSSGVFSVVSTTGRGEDINLGSFVAIVQNMLAEVGLNYTFESHSPTLVLELSDAHALHDQGYVLRVSGGKIFIGGRTLEGVFHGLQTLKQLIRCFGTDLPELSIEDFPDLPRRGYMLDVSRDRIPKMETLKRLVDILAELKYNQLQLYMEHTFAYARHWKVWNGYSPFTSEEIRELDSYCAERFIELVPNQNTFGHMTKWLIHDEYRHLAEAPDGFTAPWGTRYEYPFSLSPVVSESLQLVEEILSELLPNFQSRTVNIGCDETFDLCLGRSKELCEKLGPGRVYLDFLLKVYGTAKKYKDRVMFWGDIIENHPELLPELPKDLIPMVWGYEADHPFAQKCPLYAKSGLEFYVCPGTSTWNSFVGRSRNAFENIENAVANGLKNGASGLLLTDWGDNGHPQSPIFSLLPIAYAGALGWNYGGHRGADLEDFLDAVDLQLLQGFWRDDGGTRQGASKFLFDLGELHNTLPYTPNGTLLFYALLYPERFLEKIVLTDQGTVELLRDRIRRSLDLCESVENPLLREELSIGLRFADHGARVVGMVLEHGGIQSVPEAKWKTFVSSLLDLIEDYKRLWLELSRPGGLEQSVDKLTRILRVRHGETKSLIF